MLGLVDRKRSRAGGDASWGGYCDLSRYGTGRDRGCDLRVRIQRKRAAYAADGLSRVSSTLRDFCQT